MTHWGVTSQNEELYTLPLVVMFDLWAHQTYSKPTVLSINPHGIFPLCQFPLNIDQMGIDEVEIDKVEIDEVGIDKVGINHPHEFATVSVKPLGPP